MVTKIQSLHFDADQRLVMLVEEKIEKLKHYFKADASAEVILKMEKVGQVQDKIVEIIYHIPGAKFVVTSIQKSFELALNEAYHNIKMQILKYKEKAQIGRAHV